MALYRSPLTVTLWPSSFLKKYGPMIPPAHKAHQTVSFSGCNGVSTYTCGLASLQMWQFDTPCRGAEAHLICRSSKSSRWRSGLVVENGIPPQVEIPHGLWRSSLHQRDLSFEGQKIDHSKLP
ncbi:hypothetical protein TNCV_2607901 [Trichonephila clavipes]|uniref:Uncharacterized protein n=1 Tax=Trichonephila clavipes TaxID=2585209 RepID=A0A8X6RWQ7_TRICX|nr:hypothetical protein TNCV_2607901 [Trichonephila clavipes]